jgi:hypothetical protein
MHITEPVLVWVDVDVGIAWLVRYLNRWHDIRTHASCQGTTQEGGVTPAHVMVTWNEDGTLLRLLREFDVTLLGSYFGNVHPR